jgi:glycosyltransferase involved in cell wall biosynthesis
LKNIVHFTQDYRVGKPQLGGYSRILNQLDDGNNHYIFTIGEKFDDYSIETKNGKSVRVFQIGVNSTNYFSLLRQPFLIIRIVLKMKVQLTRIKVNPNLFLGHAQLLNFYVLWLLRLLFFRKSKLMWEFNVIWGFDQYSNFKIYVRSKIQYLSQCFIMKQCDALLFQTNYCRDFIFKEFNIIEKKNIVILNSVYSIKSNNDIKRNPNAILVYGLLDDLNGIPFLLNFIENFHKELDIEYHFYGMGVYAEKINKLSQMNPKIKYFGSVSKNEIPEILMKYKFGIIPRIKTLGSDLYIPTKVIEMINYGIVVIGADVRGLTEVLIDNETGFVYSAEDTGKLFKVLKNALSSADDKIILIQSNGKKMICESFNLEIQLRKQKEFIDHLFDK